MDKHERLRAARIAAGFDSAADAARAKGWNLPAYRHHENGTAGFKADRAREYALAFGITTDWLLYGDGPGPHDPDGGAASARPEPVRRWIPLVGEVAAGVWQEQEPVTFDDAIELLPIDVPGYERAQLFALRVRGSSMNLFYPDGRIVVLVHPAEAGIREGDHVIVRRWRSGLYETTIKEVTVEDGQVVLWPRSTDPLYQTPIRFEPREDEDQDGPEIVGIVIADYGKRLRPDGPPLLT